MATTLTVCEQAVLDLAAYKQALADLLTGKRVVSVREGDKQVDYFAQRTGTVESLQNIIRLKQAEVDRCNGVRSRGRFIRHAPSDL